MKKFLTLGILVFTFTAYAQEVSVVQVDAPQEVPFAQPFETQITLSHPQGKPVELVADSMPPEFEVTAARLEPLDPQTTRAHLTVVPFTLQKSTFTVQFALPQDPAQHVVARAPLTVKPVKLFDDNGLREIRPPHKVFDWALWLCILLALFALACLIIFWVRRLKQAASSAEAAPVDNRPAYVIALSQIDLLLDSGLWERQEYKTFYITLSDILRTYLHRAFGLDVSADTSAELLRHIKKERPLLPLVQAVRTFLASGDLVKFAKAVPTEQTRNRDITLLRNLITQTAPKPQEPPKQVEVKL